MHCACTYDWLTVCVRVCMSVYVCVWEMQAETDQTAMGVWKRGSEAWRPALLRSSHHSSLTCPVYPRCVSLDLIVCVCVQVCFKHSVDVEVAAGIEVQASTHWGVCAHCWFVLTLHDVICTRNPWDVSLVCVCVIAAECAKHQYIGF